jgi:hypothetical protein
MSHRCNTGKTLNDVTGLPELGGRHLPQDAAERLQGRSVAPALAAHQVERPLDAQPGDRQHGQGARGTFRAHRQPRHDWLISRAWRWLPPAEATRRVCLEVRQVD